MKDCRCYYFIIHLLRKIYDGLDFWVDIDWKHWFSEAGYRDCAGGGCRSLCNFCHSQGYIFAVHQNLQFYGYGFKGFGGFQGCGGVFYNGRVKVDHSLGFGGCSGYFRRMLWLGKFISLGIELA
ncbi:hypothetical protein GBA52_002969 [Prunus armeniaca]|nr:hypothetical protein GBA52_002969 [Prunus armeniaca]